MVRRRIAKALKMEMSEIDYWDKLSSDERAYLYQFLVEYYQGDFNHETPLHPKEKVKECYSRNNASKRQLHSVGEEILAESVRKVRNAQGGNSNMYYTPEDYMKDVMDHEYTKE